ncbi:hypothetical protein D3C73_946170 [compost metagenome]
MSSSANSSPPVRAGRSESRLAAAITWATSTSTASPMLWLCWSLTSLKWSMSSTTRHSGWPLRWARAKSRASASSKPRRLANRVSASSRACLSNASACRARRSASSVFSWFNACRCTVCACRSKVASSTRRARRRLLALYCFSRKRYSATSAASSTSPVSACTLRRCHQNGSTVKLHTAS